MHWLGASIGLGVLRPAADIKYNRASRLGTCLRGRAWDRSVHRAQSLEALSLKGRGAAQELDAHKGVVWVLVFSNHGRYLASGGADGVVRVWKVIDGRGEQVWPPFSNP